MRLQNPRRAIALILTLMLLAVLIAVVAHLAFTASLDHQSAGNESGRVANDVALTSARDMVFARLDITAKINNDGGSQEEGTTAPGSTEPEPPEEAGSENSSGDKKDGEEEEEEETEEQKKSYHTLFDPWTTKIEEKLGDTKLEVEVVDEERKFDLLTLVKGEDADKERAVKELQTLLEDILPKTAEVTGERLAQDIQKWLKDKSSQMVEKDTKKLEDSGIPILVLEELAFIRGVDDAILHGSEERGKEVPGILEFVTIHSNGKLNINTISQEVLGAIIPEGVEDKDGLVSAILEKRGGKTSGGSKSTAKKTTGDEEGTDPATDPETDPEAEPEPDSGASPNSSGSGQGFFKSVDELKEIAGMDKEVSTTEESTTEKTGGAGTETETEAKTPGSESEGEKKKTVFDVLKDRLAVRSENFGVQVKATTGRFTKEAYFVIERGKKESRVVYYKAAEK